MSEATLETAATTQTETPAPKKATKKPVKGKPAKGKKAKAEKTSTRPNSESGLRTAQVRILTALKSGKAMNKTQINEACAKAGFETAKKFSQWMADPLGSRNPKVSKAAEDRCGYKSLLTLGFVKPDEVDVDGHKEHVYVITSKGKAALAKA